MLYKVGEHSIPLFRIRLASKTLGMENQAIRKKELIGHIPPTNYHTKLGHRLYMIEDIALLDYIFRHVWTKHRGIPFPDKGKEASILSFNIARAEVEKSGKVTSQEIFFPVQEIWEDFIPGEAMSKILYWQSILSEEDIQEKEEICPVEDKFNISQFLDNF